MTPTVTRTGARGLLVAGFAGGLLLALAPAASAHPLGNFTVNTADRIVVGSSDVQVLHAVDLAEIPTLQLTQGPDSPDADRDGTLAEGELSAWAAAECTRTVPQLSLVLDGQPAALALTSSGARRVEGAAGLPTLRLNCAFTSEDVPATSVAFEDRSAAGRTGWKEVSATALCGSVTGQVARESPSALLDAYPSDLLSSPLAITTASFGVEAGGPCRSDPSVPGSSVLPAGVDRLTAAYSGFVSRQELTLPVALLAVLLSIALGVGHAVAPGHGKTVIAAYLVGQRGTRRQAVWLGATVTATHTAGVLLLGALLSLTSVASPERFVPTTEIVSGLLLAGVGVFLLRRAVASRAPGARLREIAHGHSHRPDGDSHSGHGHGDSHVGNGHHDHSDGGRNSDGAIYERVAAGDPAPFGAPPPAAPLPSPGEHSHDGHTHTHLPDVDQPLGWRTLATMGIAGGLVPSPSALVVLLGAAALGRPVFGALLVVGYGVGMALTLTLAGLLLLRTQARLERRGWTSGRAARLLKILPTVTAGVVLLVGAIVVLRGLLTFQDLL